MYALIRIPYGNASILHATAPIFVAFLARRLVGEQVSQRVFALLPMFILGVGLVVKPQVSLAILPNLAALGSGFLGGLAYLSVRKLGETDRGITIVFYFTGVTTLMWFPFALFHWKPLDGAILAQLIAIGVFGTGAQLAMTRAYKLERASLVSLFAYATPILAFLFGIALFNEQPDFAATLGALLVVVCGLIATQISRRSVEGVSV
jgi:drug/metabolite transporter (DMT)-like permease